MISMNLRLNHIIPYQLKEPSTSLFVDVNVPYPGKEAFDDLSKSSLSAIGSLRYRKTCLNLEIATFSRGPSWE